MFVTILLKSALSELNPNNAHEICNYNLDENWQPCKNK